jgi:uncharacterized protein involved in outer membrane biogenesis
VKRYLLIAAAIVVVAGLGLVLLARQVLTGANVHAAIESQVSAALGQPVSIGSIGASVYPRVTLDLTKVSIGKPSRIELGTVHVGTGLRALLSRRIERADVRIDGARLSLPLPSLGKHDPTPAPDTKPPVEIVSIDEIVLKNVEVVSGGRTLRGDIELVPHKAGVTIRRVALAADGTAVTMTGELIALTPLSGKVDVVAETLDIDRLIAFVGEFVSATASAPPASVAAAPAGPAGPAVALHGGPVASPVGQVVVGLKVGRMTTGGLTLSDFASTALVTPNAIRFEPLTLGIFGGRYQGSMQLGLGGVPAFQWQAKVAGIDAAALMAFAGSPNTITGTLSGTVALAGSGLQMEQALRTAHGRSRIDITDGTIAGLQLVRTIVTATSGRGGILASAGAAVAGHTAATGGEKFSRFGATLQLANGVIETSDVSMTSADLDLSATGSLALAAMSADLAGRAQLSEALSQQAGTDLYRYTQEGGRVTVPVTVTGPLDRLAVRVDVGDVAKRAIRNKATEEAQKLIEKKLPGLRGLFQRKPR